jgi:hypothetical protein
VTTEGLLRQFRGIESTERRFPHWVEWAGLQLLFPILPLLLSLATLGGYASYSHTPSVMSVTEVADEALLGLIGMAMLGNSMAAFKRRPWSKSGRVIFTLAIMLLAVGIVLSVLTSWLRFAELHEVAARPELADDGVRAFIRVAVQGYWLSFVIPICFAMDFRKAEA